MHGFPCSALRHCFGSPPDVTTNSALSLDPDPSRPIRTHLETPGVMGPVLCQLVPEPDAPVEHQPHHRTVSCISTHPRTRILNGTNSNSQPPRRENHSFKTSPILDSLSDSSEDDPEPVIGLEVPMKYPIIPRPSIIIRQPKEPEFQEGSPDSIVCCARRLPSLATHPAPLPRPAPPMKGLVRKKLDGPVGEAASGSSLDCCVDPGLSPGRSVMAEPDYLDGDCEELIKPKKLMNPVKGSRNHQDLHRELMMNQKRGLAPQNKPELQKVLENRKREQVLKAQREEQDAHTKRSDLEIELMKRQQKLEQLELDQQKGEEEQENTPEFVKMKSNLRRTKQEADGEERTT
ncbi:hypothetical protein DPEC_G00166490 [Dallia pectoralis]|uniref:Uncharacterized protein n=1 Tax=Dallia pectoralis TaxID=75939 RepID=A0ACC2GHM7_DALPE|nr:hypothetical protein DPEC_G00166490 [Dallia pectoralis]